MFSVLLRPMKKSFSLPRVPVQDPQDATRYSLREMLGGRCCRCKQDLRGHEYQMFAVTVAVTERREALLDFFHLAKTHAWQSLSKYQEFDGSKNAAAVFALRCPNGDLTALYVCDPFELFESKSLESRATLGEKDAQEWAEFLPEKEWVAFNEIPKQ
jgi:hypothetical protein